MDDLLVECPIHLDAVSIKGILVFKCGHGFCVRCLDQHFAHCERPSQSTCPTCRQPVRRKDAFPLFLAPGHQARSSSPPSTGGSSCPSSPTELLTSDADASDTSKRKQSVQSLAADNRRLRTRIRNNQRIAESSRMQLIAELEEAKATHADCSTRHTELQRDVDTLRHHGARYIQTIQNLRGQNEMLEKRLAKESEKSTRAAEESDQMSEEVMKLLAENQKTSKALEQARKEAQVEHERVKLFRGYTERYKRKCGLERKKRKALETANCRSQPKIEDESLMVVDANAPDMLHQGDPDHGWLDEACKVRGDQLDVADEGLESEEESEDELRLGTSDTKEKQWASWRDLDKRAAGNKMPLARFPSDWNLGLEALARPSSGVARKRRRGDSQMGGSKFFKVSMEAGKCKPVLEQKLPGVVSDSRAADMVPIPLVIDRLGQIKGTVALGSRQKLNSKN